jgi:Flp pilus assembly protein TadB
MVPPCPLTGYCADDDLLDSLIRDCRAGHSLEDCFRWIADNTAKLIDQEEAYCFSDEAIREDLTANEYDFTEDGTRI